MQISRSAPVSCKYKMNEENAEESTDGSLNLEISAANSDTPPAEAVAQLHPTSFKAAKDAAEKSMRHPAIKKKMTSALWDVDRYFFNLRF